jgi:UDP-glucose 4-epimerase
MGPGCPQRERGRGRGAAALNRTVLITGGAGFIGSSLARLLVERGDRVRVLDNLSIGSLAYLADVPHDLVDASLSDRSAIAGALVGADAVVHLAARAGIPDSVADPLGTFEANVADTVALLDAARLAGAERFVFASSNAAAGDHPPPADETDLPHPLSPYGASKLAGEAYCQAYAATYGLVASALRFSNAYGPYSLHKKSVVAAWLRAALRGEPITIHGDGEQTRDFVYAGDLAAAVVAVLDAPAGAVAGEIFQAGTGQETTVNTLADTIGRAVGRPLEIRRGPDRPGDIRRNVSRVDKAASRLGYRASVGLEEGLARTARWYETALADRELAGIVPHAVSGSD